MKLTSSSQSINDRISFVLTLKDSRDFMLQRYWQASAVGSGVRKTFNKGLNRLVVCRFSAKFDCVMQHASAKGHGKNIKNNMKLEKRV